MPKTALIASTLNAPARVYLQRELCNRYEARQTRSANILHSFSPNLSHSEPEENVSSDMLMPEELMPEERKLLSLTSDKFDWDTLTELFTTLPDALISLGEEIRHMPFIPNTQIERQANTPIQGRHLKMETYQQFMDEAWQKVRDDALDSVLGKKPSEADLQKINDYLDYSCRLFVADASEAWNQVASKHQRIVNDLDIQR